MKAGWANIVRELEGESAQVCTLNQLHRTASALERLRGLLGRKKLAAASGLWIEPCNSVHSFFMSYSLDILYLDRMGCITHIRHCLKPWRASAHWRARSVIELAAGEAQRLGIATGDHIRWKQNDE